MNDDPMAKAIEQMIIADAIMVAAFISFNVGFTLLLRKIMRRFNGK